MKLSGDVVLGSLIFAALFFCAKSAKACKAPNIPDNAELYFQSRNKTVYRSKDQVIYRCRAGYFQSGLMIRECRHGNWTPISFTCSKSTRCGSAGVMTNGKTTVQSNLPRGKAWYSCKSGYLLHGQEVRLCQENLTWSGEKPECKAIDCGTLRRPRHGVKTKDTGSSWKGRVEFKCTKRGYVMTGSPTRICNSDGKWSGIRTRCRAPCADPGYPPGMTRRGRNFKHGGKIHFDCPPTHRLQGDKTITCHDGAWSAKVPSCAVKNSDKDFTVCGIISARRQRRITGSGHSLRGAWPWQIGLYRRSVNGSHEFLCGGALINNRWVVTAAHCFKRHAEHQVVNLRPHRPHLYAIKAGDHNMSHDETTEQKVRVERIIVHANYQKGTFESDIALVKLKWSMELNYHVRPVCLPRRQKDGTFEDLARPGNIGFVAGWGATQVLELYQEPSEDRKVSEVLRQASFKVKSDGLCRNSTKHHFNSSVMFCVGNDNVGVGICKGDSGGPFVVEVMRGGRKRWVAAGLVSWGEGCGLADRFDYYTRLSSYVDWIHKNIKKPRPSRRNIG